MWPRANIEKRTKRTDIVRRICDETDDTRLKTLKKYEPGTEGERSWLAVVVRSVLMIHTEHPLLQRYLWKRLQLQKKRNTILRESPLPLEEYWHKRGVKGARKHHLRRVALELLSKCHANHEASSEEENT